MSAAVVSNRRLGAGPGGRGPGVCTPHAPGAAGSGRGANRKAKRTDLRPAARRAPLRALRHPVFFFPAFGRPARLERVDTAIDTAIAAAAFRAASSAERHDL